MTTTRKPGARRKPGLAKPPVRAARAAAKARGAAKRNGHFASPSRAGSLNHLGRLGGPRHAIHPSHPSHLVTGPGAEMYPTSPLGEQVKGIPTGRDVEWEPLVDYRRYGVSETTIHGAVAWATGPPSGKAGKGKGRGARKAKGAQGRIFHSFGGNVLCYGRSMMKPLVMKVFSEELAGLTWEQKAIACSSHNGDTEHVAAAQSMLMPTEWGLMQAPLDVPLVQFGRQVRRPRRWYHTCSGEHAALIRGCKEKGWPRIGYLLPQHPWFQAYLDQVRRFLGPDWQPLRVARDGCGLPTASNTVGELALLYASLAQRKDEDWVWEAMVRSPDLVGGFNRLDSTIIKAGKGRVLAKEGADGLLGLAIEHEDYPDGLGVVVKIAHGWNPRATWYVARAILGVLGFELRNPYKLHRQKAFLVPGIVPPKYLKRLETVPTWDDWDPNDDRWYYDWSQWAPEWPAPGWGP